MDIGILSILHTQIFDFHRQLASGYAAALRNAMTNGGEKTQKKQSYFVSAKRGLEDKLYVGNIHRIENHLYWNDEELADDDQIINVVMMVGPVTRDGGACSYGTKDLRDQVLYANTIPQVVGHLFYINTPGGESACRNDYEMMINDCRKMGKPVVAFVDGLCASSGVNFASRADRVIVMNGKDEFGCIGSMAAFWATPDGAIDRDGSRYVELVGEDCPGKNDWYREAAKGEYDKLQAMLDKSTKEFHQSVRENRPLVEDWMLTGEIFEAEQLIPALVDEIGDYNRAIECVFELADQKMQAARFATPPTEEDPEDKPDDEPDKEPEEMAQLSQQQKAAVNTSRGDLMMVDDGHVTKEVPGFFGPQTVEVANPKNENNMPDKEKKAAEAQEAQAAEQQKPAEEQEQKPAEEEQKPAEEQEQKPSEEEEQKSSEEEQKSDEEEKPAEKEEEKPADQPSEEALQNAEEDIDKIQETLHNAEQMVADRDKEIASLKESLATLKDIASERDAAVKERDEISASLEKKEIDFVEQGKVLSEAEAKIAEHVATIEKLTKQVADLKAEVKELAGAPAPMADAAAGIPAGNGTGDAPKDMGSVKSEMPTEEEISTDKD